MSPSPATSLEVERYIGACLISQHNHVKAKQPFYQHPNRERYAPPDGYHPHNNRNFSNVDQRFRAPICNPLDGWAGGMPLISFANQRRNRRPPPQQQHHHHQQPPPPLLDHRNHQIRCVSPRFEEYNLARLAVHTQGAPLILAKSYNHRKNKVHRNGKIDTLKPDLTKCHSVPDTISVASDESSGSANSSSENCLPRIIKPRKRRKKDRKLPTFENSFGSPSQPEDFFTDSSSASPEINLGLVSFDSYKNYFDLVPDKLPFASKRDAQVDFSEAPQLHHAFEDLEDLEDGKDYNGNTSNCQCRYCDPSGQIWDVDRSCYSSFLTPPDLTNVFTCGGPSSLLSGLAALRLDGAESDRWNVSDSSSSSRDLEVSTEIVTSLNGHRDLEIRFFTTPSVDTSGTRTCSDRMMSKGGGSNDDGACIVE